MNNLFGLFNTSNHLKIINFENMQECILDSTKYIIISVLPPDQQDYLILHTLSINLEEQTINELVTNNDMSLKIIIIYGKNSSDYDLLVKKNKQLSSLGFIVYAYLGGLFEWFLLQDIYGFDEFPTTKTKLDILFFRPSRYTPFV